MAVALVQAYMALGLSTYGTGTYSRQVRVYLKQGA